MTAAYVPHRLAHSRYTTVRGLRHHVLAWGDPGLITPERPALVMGHGYMDVGASFQFVVDALATLEGPTRYILAHDWRGFGRTDTPASDSYWFPDYLGDLDALLAAGELGLSADVPVDLLGHSMGGNIVMSYAGLRPTRIRRLVNLEGFGMPRSSPQDAPAKLTMWLEGLRSPRTLRPYASAAAVAERLRQTNPRLPLDKALWLATQWAEQSADGLWHLQADPAHKHPSALQYQAEEVLACWRRITAPLLWIEGRDTEAPLWWGARYPHSEFEARLAVVPQVSAHALGDCGHMVHHDQPEAVATLLQGFLKP
ncbi:MAG TPA: alpha/beta hydrolase [Ideonella sp.]|uniref:alpha/beta fold hydrolase n=1 Tax=Ideonella sp. TaxID=1929293 RepID=UPI002B884F15|nr:alpha/beta hydrolase [Ideonella sp.]HSI47026.1 alpha/beta hydrolase [Ideonella sp.]